MDRSRSLSRLLVPLFILMLAGCASSPPAEQAPMSSPTPTPAPTSMATPAPTTSMTTMSSDPNMATVVIYRPKSFMGMALQPTVMLDGEELIDARNGTMWTGKFKPGKYNIQMDDKKSGGEMDLKAGETYYLRVEIVPGVFKGGGRMTQVTSSQGEKDTAKLNPLPAAEVKHTMFKGM